MPWVVLGAGGLVTGIDRDPPWWMSCFDVETVLWPVVSMLGAAMVMFTLAATAAVLGLVRRMKQASIDAPDAAKAAQREGRCAPQPVPQVRRARENGDWSGHTPGG
jgi:hypothetical protein